MLWSTRFPIVLLFKKNPSLLLQGVLAIFKERMSLCPKLLNVYKDLMKSGYFTPFFGGKVAFTCSGTEETWAASSCWGCSSFFLPSFCLREFSATSEALFQISAWRALPGPCSTTQCPLLSAASLQGPNVCGPNCWPFPLSFFGSFLI